MDELKVAFQKVYDLNDEGEESKKAHYLAMIYASGHDSHIAYASFGDMYNSLLPESIKGTLKENLLKEDYDTAINLMKEKGRYRLNKTSMHLRDDDMR